MTTYFIADLHLSETNEESSNLFFDFISSKANSADALYILGDLFDFWIGDDYDTGFLQRTKDTLAKLSNKVPVFLMHGNRDFLIGKKFLTETHCKLIPDPHAITLYGQKVLLTHGDILCTNDHKYQKFRDFVQHSITRWLFLKLPKTIRLKIVQHLRRNSNRIHRNNMTTNTEIFDVNQQTVAYYLQKFQASCIIHGHTHCPQIHEFTLNNHTVKRIVLGNWTTHAKILAYGPNSIELQHLKN